MTTNAIHTIYLNEARKLHTIQRQRRCRHYYGDTELESVSDRLFLVWGICACGLRKALDLVNKL